MYNQSPIGEINECKGVIDYWENEINDANDRIEHANKVKAKYETELAELRKKYPYAEAEYEVRQEKERENRDKSMEVSFEFALSIIENNKEEFIAYVEKIRGLIVNNMEDNNEN